MAQPLQPDNWHGAPGVGGAFALLHNGEPAKSVFHYEKRLFGFVDQAEPEDQIYIAAQQLGAFPAAAVLGLSDHGRHRLINIFSKDTDYAPGREGLQRLKRAALNQGEFAGNPDPGPDLAFFEATASLANQAKADAAARFITGLDEADVMFMRPDTHLHMFKALQQAGRLTPAINDARFVLHNSVDAGEAYYKGQAAFHRQLVSTLAQDTKVQNGLSNWHRMDDDRRLDLLQHVTDVQNRLNGHESVRVVSEAIDPSRIDGKTAWLRGKYRPGGDVTINRAYKAFWDKPELVIGTVVHENTHHHQHVLGKQYRDGQITSGDANYMAAALFDDGINHGYVTSGTDARRYRKQLVEKSARDTQKLVEQELSGMGLSYDPDAERQLEAMLKAFGSSDADISVIDYVPTKQPSP